MFAVYITLCSEVAVNINISVLWDITPCSMVDGHYHFSLCSRIFMNLTFKIVMVKQTV
jgi:hypothetical protein